MRIQSLRLRTFRNHDDTSVEFGGGINALIGRNGQGKTNILEAVSYLSLGKSFFAALDTQVVQHNAQYFDIRASFISDSGRETEASIEFAAQEGEKVVRISGSPLEKVSAIVGEYPAVLLSPDHGGIVASGPAERRKFLDIMLCQTSVRYLNDLQEYRRILRQRNRVLLDGRHQGGIDAGVLEPWNEALVDHGSRIVQKRMECAGFLQEPFMSAYVRLAGSTEPVGLVYAGLHGLTAGMDAKGIGALYRERLHAHRHDEQRRGTTLVGPHRDDLEFLLRGLNAQEHASQGEHKTLLIALKTAELIYVRTVRNETPMLLLDDVFAELDSERAARVLGQLQENGQALLTVTDAGLLAGNIAWDTHHRRYWIERGTCTAYASQERREEVVARSSCPGA
jgi:DNA replication and repair protein RecF